MEKENKNLTPTSEKSKQLFVRKPIKKTPFFTIETENEDGTKKVQVVFGNNIVAPDFGDVESARRYVASKPWELILTTAHLFVKHMSNFKEQEQ